MTVFVPVVDHNQNPLMPTIPSRARRWIKSGKATPFWKHGVFCVRLNQEPSAQNVQPIAIGIDPGSKKEGYTVKSAAHTYLNIQADAVDAKSIQKKLKTRREMRRTRRNRNTPCRKPRWNRNQGKFRLPPSTKARWQWKLRVCNWLLKLFPQPHFIVEDIKAETKKGKRKWNKSFSPLEVGKQWFYTELKKLGPLKLFQGYQTSELRDQLGLVKTNKKLAEVFSAHCVDSYAMAYASVGGHPCVDNESMIFIKPLSFHRRKLHVLQPTKGGIRKHYGGTKSHGFTRGSLVKHPKYGVAYVGGYMKDCISLHNIINGKRLAQNVKPKDCKFICYNSWITRNKSLKKTLLCT